MPRGDPVLHLNVNHQWHKFRLRNAADLDSLEGIWREMKESGKRPDAYCTKQYSQRKEYFLKQ